MSLELEQLAEQLQRRLFVELEASGRHVHVTREQAQVLFGHDLTPERPLSQPGQYLAAERVTIAGPKGKQDGVAVLGPCRSQAQVEISLTDARALGVTPPVRLEPPASRSSAPRALCPCPRASWPPNGTSTCPRRTRPCRTWLTEMWYG